MILTLEQNSYSTSENYSKYYHLKSLFNIIGYFFTIGDEKIRE